MVRLSRPAKTFTPKQGQYLAFIHLYTRLHRRPPAKPICSNTSALAHPRFTKWCSHSNAGDSSEDSQERPAASNCSSIPNCCPNYFECRFNQSKPLCRGTSSFRHGGTHIRRGKPEARFSHTSQAYPVAVVA